MSTQMKESNDQRIFRGTNRQKGRHISISPENSAMKHLVYGRIILDQEVPGVSFATGTLESGLICLAGQCTVTAAGQAFELNRSMTRSICRETPMSKSLRAALWIWSSAPPKSNRRIHCRWFATRMWKKTAR